MTFDVPLCHTLLVLLGLCTILGHQNTEYKILIPTFGVVFKYLSSSLSQETVFIQPVLNISQTSDSVPQIIA